MAGVLASLPAPPIVGRVLFESQIAAPVVAGAIGLVVVASLARAGQVGRARVALVIAIVATLGLAILNWAVSTPREQLEARTRALVTAVAFGDTAAVEDMIAKRCVLRVDGDGADVREPRDFVLGRIGVVSHAIETHAARIVSSIADTPTSGRVRFSVRANVRGGGVNFTVWLAEWRKDADGAWRLYTLDWKKLNGQPPSARSLLATLPT